MVLDMAAAGASNANRASHTSCENSVACGAPADSFFSPRPNSHGKGRCPLHPSSDVPNLVGGTPSVLVKVSKGGSGSRVSSDICKPLSQSSRQLADLVQHGGNTESDSDSSDDSDGNSSDGFGDAASTLRLRELREIAATGRSTLSFLGKAVSEAGNRPPSKAADALPGTENIQIVSTNAALKADGACEPQLRDRQQFSRGSSFDDDEAALAVAAAVEEVLLCPPQLLAGSPRGQPSLSSVMRTGLAGKDTEDEEEASTAAAAAAAVEAALAWNSTAPECLDMTTPSTEASTTPRGESRRACSRVDRNAYASSAPTTTDSVAAALAWNVPAPAGSSTEDELEHSTESTVGSDLSGPSRGVEADLRASFHSWRRLSPKSRKRCRVKGLTSTDDVAGGSRGARGDYDAMSAAAVTATDKHLDDDRRGRRGDSPVLADAYRVVDVGGVAEMRKWRKDGVREETDTPPPTPCMSASFSSSMEGWVDSVSPHAAGVVCSCGAHSGRGSAGGGGSGRSIGVNAKPRGLLRRGKSDVTLARGMFPGARPAQRPAALCGDCRRVKEGTKVLLRDVFVKEDLAVVGDMSAVVRAARRIAALPPLERARLDRVPDDGMDGSRNGSGSECRHYASGGKGGDAAGGAEAGGLVRVGAGKHSRLDESAAPYRYRQLAGVDRHWPAAVDPARREEWLAPAEFEAVFAMGFDEYKALPGWKQVILKQEVCLF